MCCNMVQHMASHCESTQHSTPRQQVVITAGSKTSRTLCIHNWLKGSSLGPVGCARACTRVHARTRARAHARTRVRSRSPNGCGLPPCRAAGHPRPAAQRLGQRPAGGTSTIDMFHDNALSMFRSMLYYYTINARTIFYVLYYHLRFLRVLASSPGRPPGGHAGPRGATCAP